MFGVHVDRRSNKETEDPDLARPGGVNGTLPADLVSSLSEVEEQAAPALVLSQGFLRLGCVGCCV